MGIRLQPWRNCTSLSASPVENESVLLLWFIINPSLMECVAVKGPLVNIFSPLDDFYLGIDLTTSTNI